MEKLHMQYDTIMGMLFYEFQNVLEAYSKILEERKEAEEKENQENGIDSSKYTPERMMKSIRGNAPETDLLKKHLTHGMKALTPTV
jgi:hypothetical protein